MVSEISLMVCTRRVAALVVVLGTVVPQDTIAQSHPGWCQGVGNKHGSVAVCNPTPDPNLGQSPPQATPTYAVPTPMPEPVAQPLLVPQQVPTPTPPATPQQVPQLVAQPMRVPQQVPTPTPLATPQQVPQLVAQPMRVPQQVPTPTPPATPQQVPQPVAQPMLLPQQVPTPTPPATPQQVPQLVAQPMLVPQQVPIPTPPATPRQVPQLVAQPMLVPEQVPQPIEQREPQLMVQRPVPLTTTHELVVTGRPGGNSIVHLTGSGNATWTLGQVTATPGRQKHHALPSYLAADGTIVQCLAGGFGWRYVEDETGETRLVGRTPVLRAADLIVRDVPANHMMRPDCVVLVRRRSDEGPRRMP